ncbi:MAG TPA: helix-turn-helix transcriptional regulator [Alphaproteobacteria bacterium]|nr:helix-turn-helix transcriptional regulator [Alphaproteobacteria bacterium]
MTAPTKSSLAVEIGAKFRAIRKAQDKRLSDIALKLGTSAQTVQRLETAAMTMSLEWLEKYCAALGLTPADLFAPDAERYREERRKLRAKARLLHAAGTNFLIDLDTLLGSPED